MARLQSGGDRGVKQTLARGSGEHLFRIAEADGVASGIEVDRWPMVAPVVRARGRLAAGE